MRAFVVTLLASMASMASALRPALSSRRSAVKMIYGARNPTGPFAGAPVQLQWRIDAASENVQASFYVRNGEEQQLGCNNILYEAQGVEQVLVC